MDAVAVAVVVGTIVVAGAIIAWMLFTRHHPENAASHDEGRLRSSAPDDPPTTSPADAGAEEQADPYEKRPGDAR